MSLQNIVVETRGRVGIIRLNRPQALNALNRRSSQDARRGGRRPSMPTTASAASCITGSDKAFAAGADIKEMADKSYIDVFIGDFAADWRCGLRARASR